MQNTTPTLARFVRFAFAVANHVDDEDKGVTEMMPPAASGRSSRPRAVKRSACCVRVSKRRQEQ